MVVLELLKQAGIRLAPLSQEGFLAGLALSEDGYILYLHPQTFYALPEADRTAVLAHELAHLMRGDCLVIKDKEDPALWNIAADSQINRGKMLETAKKIGGVVYEDLASQLQLPSAYLPGTDLVYKTLLAEKEQIKQVLEQVFDFLTPGSGSQREKYQHTKASLRLRKLLQSNPELADLADAMKVDVKAPIPYPSATITGDDTLLQVDLKRYKYLQYIQRLIDKIRTTAIGARSTYTRSYHREGRTELLRGSHTAYLSRVVMALDVSGSMYDYLDLIFSIAYGLLLSGVALHLITFDHKIQHEATEDKALALIKSNKLRGLGGTCFSPVMQRVSQLKPDVLVMVTDGIAADRYSLPLCPVIWLLTYDTDGILRRKKDMREVLCS